MEITDLEITDQVSVMRVHGELYGNDPEGQSRWFEGFL